MLGQAGSQTSGHSSPSRCFFIFSNLGLLTYVEKCSVFVPDNPDRRGTVSTAFSHCRVCVQRLQKTESYASIFSGSFRRNPWTLRSERLQWLANLSGKQTVPASSQGISRWTPCDLGLCKKKPVAKIPAFPRSAFGLSISLLPKRTLRLKARTGTSPPPSFQHSRAPP